MLAVTVKRVSFGFVFFPYMTHLCRQCLRQTACDIRSVDAVGIGKGMFLLAGDVKGKRIYVSLWLQNSKQNCYGDLLLKKF